MRRTRLSLVVVCLAPLSAANPPRRARRKQPESTSKCGETPVENSLGMIEVILKDIKDTYTLPGGGGIGEIKAVAETTFTVSIAQEERVDLITYELEIIAHWQPSRRVPKAPSPIHDNWRAESDQSGS